MCSVCMSTPCHSRCPNVSELVPVYSCCKCGVGIWDGEKYYDSPEGYVCEGCIEDMTAGEFMDLIGDTLSTAVKEE